MNEPLYDTLLSYLVGDFTSEDELAIVLNFLEHTTSTLRLLYWKQVAQSDAKREAENKLPLF